MAQLGRPTEGGRQAGRQAPPSSALLRRLGPGRGRDARGFTLVEVLVALLVMSIIAAMAWQGIDGMVRTRDSAQRRLEATLRLGTVVAQWQQDLASLQESRAVPTLRCDGASLQLTRRAPGGLQLVVWSLRGGRLLRWAPPVVAGNLALQDQWLRSQQLLAEDPAQVRMLEGVAQWQLYYFRRNAWTHCQSSADLLVAPAPATPVSAVPSAGAISGATSGSATADLPSIAQTRREELPTGVRLVLGFAPGSGFAGTFTRDTLLPPQWP